ncbi:MAG: hypothetical protein RJA07_1923 [Bacteroidota bacterium]|jgi:hypothetical protein
MVNQQKPVVTIINRHYPPNPGITGEAAWDLAKYLDAKNIAVQIVHINRTSEGGGERREPFGTIYKVSSIYTGKNETIRFVAAIFDSVSLLAKAIGVRKKGVIICMTSPPMLAFWGGLFFKLFNVPWFFWSMDLFPESFYADGKISNTNSFYKIVKKISYAFKPKALIAMGYKQAEYINAQYNKPVETLVLPCGVITQQHINNEKPIWRTDDSKIYFGYCGNIGLAHDERSVVELAKAINSTKHQLILALYGVKAEALKAQLKNIDGVILVDNVPRSQLHFIDVHLVCLMDKWTHAAVPSKAVSSICAGGSILFLGNENSDNWFMLQRAGWRLNPDESIQHQIENLLADISFEKINSKKAEAKLLAIELSKLVTTTYQQIAEKIFRD